jgi:hypothetical protein
MLKKQLIIMLILLFANQAAGMASLRQMAKNWLKPSLCSAAAGFACHALYNTNAQYGTTFKTNSVPKPTFEFFDFLTTNTNHPTKLLLKSLMKNGIYLLSKTALIKPRVFLTTIIFTKAKFDNAFKPENRLCYLWITFQSVLAFMPGAKLIF